jgi:antitoxin HicB
MTNHGMASPGRRGEHRRLRWRASLAWTAGGGCPYVSLTGILQHDSIASMAKARYHYNIMLRPEPEGGYTALVPALPGCVTYGRTVDEAREMAKDAISGYIASLRKHKDPIPTDDNTLVASLDLEYAEVTRR